jgi:hypothetical protein
VTSTIPRRFPEALDHDGRLETARRSFSVGAESPPPPAFSRPFGVILLGILNALGAVLYLALGAFLLIVSTMQAGLSDDRSRFVYWAEPAELDRSGFRRFCVTETSTVQEYVEAGRPLPPSDADEGCPAGGRSL